VSAVHYTAPPTVSRLMDSDAFFRGIVGPVGSGKSSGCILELLQRAATQRPGPDGVRRTRWAIIRNTYRELRDTTRKTFEEWIRPGELGEWKEADFTFALRFNDVEADVLFRALDRPEDVKKLLSLELTGAYVNEFREIRKTILDVLQSRVGRYPSRANGGPTWFGIWGDTNPMHVGHELYNLLKREKPEGYALFEQPSGLSPQAENVHNLPAGYYERLCHGKDEEWVDEYVRGKYPKRDRGSIFGDLLGALEERGGMRPFQHPMDGVFVSFDLGISDATAMWFWRLNGAGAVDVVDYYEATGKPISHFFDELDRRRETLGFEYTRFWLPHDARARTLVTGASVLDRFLETYPGMAAITPQLSLEDGLQAARWLLEKPCRFHPRAASGVEALRAYRYEFDEDRKVFSRKPLHDFSSHGADAWRYVACAVKMADLATRRPVAPEKPVVRDVNSFTLEELYEARGAQQKRSRV
jgi:hypothetical protein